MYVCLSKAIHTCISSYLAQAKSFSMSQRLNDMSQCLNFAHFIHSYQQAAMNIWFRILINFSQAQQECFSFRTNKVTISKKLYTPTRSQNLTHHNLHGL